MQSINYLRRCPRRVCRERVPVLPFRFAATGGPMSRSPCPMTRSAPAVRKRDPAFLSRLLRPILRATTKGNNSGARPRRWFTFLVYQQPWTSGHSSRYKNCTSAEDGERTIAVNGGRTTAEEMEGAAEARVRVRPSRRCCTSELSRGRTGARDPYGTVRPHHRE